MVFYTVQPVRLLHAYSSSLVIGWAMIVGGVCFCVVAPPWRVPGTWDGFGVACLLVIVLLGTLVAFYSYLTAVRWLGATTTSLLTCAEPVVAATLTVAWLHVPFGWMDWAGTGCVLGTILLLAFRGNSYK
jgi:drug/metabolite transporter (DMT)-like permease